MQLYAIIVLLCITSVPSIFGMQQQDDTVRNYIKNILRQRFPTFKPIAKDGDHASGTPEGDIHVYYSSSAEQAHVLTARSNDYGRHCIDRSGVLTSYKLDIAEYVWTLNIWNTHVQYQFLEKLLL